MAERLTVAEIRRRRAALARRLGRRGELMRGSLAEIYVRCGRKDCRCAQGQKHGPYLYVSVFQGRRTKSVYVPRHLEGEVRRWVANALAVQGDIFEITRLNIELLRRAREEGRRPAGGSAGSGGSLGSRRSGR
jgi:hypothetical protein